MPKTITLSFQEQFETAITSGRILQTIRRERTGAPPEPGDFVHCYIKQRTRDCRLIYASLLRDSRPIRITTRAVFINVGAKEWQRIENPTDFAQQDGFDGPTAFHQQKTFLGVEQGKPFIGRLYRWYDAASLIQDATAEAMLAVNLNHSDGLAGLTAAPAAVEIDRRHRYARAVESQFSEFDTVMLKQAETHIGRVWAALEWHRRRKENPDARHKAKKTSAAPYSNKGPTPIDEGKA